MKKLMIFLMFVCVFATSFVGNNFAWAASFEDYIVTNTSYVYESADLSSEKLVKKEFGESVSVEIENGAAKIYTNGAYSFCKVKNIDLSEGYILSDMIVPQSNSTEQMPNFNASAARETHVFVKDNENFVQSIYSLAAGEKIFLYEGYDQKLDYTPIAFERNNQIIYAYVKTQDITPNGINPVIIYIATIILAIVCIVLTWVFMKNSKTKIKIQK